LHKEYAGRLYSEFPYKFPVWGPIPDPWTDGVKAGVEESTFRVKFNPMCATCRSYGVKNIKITRVM